MMSAQLELRRRITVLGRVGHTHSFGSSQQHWNAPYSSKGTGSSHASMSGVMFCLVPQKSPTTSAGALYPNAVAPSHPFATHSKPAPPHISPHVRSSSKGAMQNRGDGPHCPSIHGRIPRPPSQKILFSPHSKFSGQDLSPQASVADSWAETAPLSSAGSYVVVDPQPHRRTAIMSTWGLGGICVLAVTRKRTPGLRHKTRDAPRSYSPKMAAFRRDPGGLLGRKANRPREG